VTDDLVQAGRLRADELVRAAAGAAGGSGGASRTLPWRASAIPNARKMPCRPQGGRSKRLWRLIAGRWREQWSRGRGQLGAEGPDPGASGLLAAPCSARRRPAWRCSPPIPKSFPSRTCPGPGGAPRRARGPATSFGRVDGGRCVRGRSGAGVPPKRHPSRRIARETARLGLPSSSRARTTSSTDERHAPTGSSDAAEPLSVYARSKWYGECRVREAGGAPRIVRSAGLYGAGGPDFVGAILSRLEEGPVRVVTDEVNSPTCVDDLAPHSGGSPWRTNRAPGT